MSRTLARHVLLALCLLAGVQAGAALAQCPVIPASPCWWDPDRCMPGGIVHVLATGKSVTQLTTVVTGGAATDDVMHEEDCANVEGHGRPFIIMGAGLDECELPDEEYACPESPSAPVIPCDPPGTKDANGILDVASCKILGGGTYKLKFTLAYTARYSSAPSVAPLYDVFIGGVGKDANQSIYFLVPGWYGANGLAEGSSCIAPEVSGFRAGTTYLQVSILDHNQVLPWRGSGWGTSMPIGVVGAGETENWKVTINTTGPPVARLFSEESGDLVWAATCTP